MFFSNGDMLLSGLFAVGLFQLLWLSVVLVRKGFAPSVVRLSLLPLFAVWVLVWPAYTDEKWLLLHFILFALPAAYASVSQGHFARHLKLCWHTVSDKWVQPPPWIMFLTSLLIAAILFYHAPELGFGVGLSVCLAWSVANLFDQLALGPKLGLAINPNQTLWGHIAWVMSASLIGAWGLQLLHGVDWRQFFIATLAAALVASAIRATVAAGWNMPIAILGMSITLWLL